MGAHEYRSQPVTVTAVQIDDDATVTAGRLAEAYGEGIVDHVRFIVEPTTTEDDAPRRVVDITVTNPDGRLATAKPGEWLLQDGPTVFHVEGDEQFRAAYRVPKRARTYTPTGADA